MTISARNRLNSRVVEVRQGAATAHVLIDVSGALVTASLTHEPVDEVGLTVGLPVNRRRRSVPNLSRRRS